MIALRRAIDLATDFHGVGLAFGQQCQRRAKEEGGFSIHIIRLKSVQQLEKAGARHRPFTPGKTEPIPCPAS
jgi:hypothetical protein